jgi:AbrB family looped-hinge helix DNA binding protein
VPTTRSSTKGQVVIPKDIRERAGMKPGIIYDVANDGAVITLTPRQQSEGFDWTPISVDELLARRVRYHGPPVTDELIRDAAAEAAVERFERSKQRDGD